MTNTNFSIINDTNIIFIILLYHFFMEKETILKFILSRYDAQFESIQSKSNLYIIINTFLLGGYISVLLKNPNIHYYLLYILIVLIILGSISITLILFVLKPFLKTGNYKSAFFFKDVSNYSLKNYHGLIEMINKKQIIYDLIVQVHCLSKGLTKKYTKLCWTGFLLLSQIVFIQLFLILYIGLKANINF